MMPRPELLATSQVTVKAPGADAETRVQRMTRSDGGSPLATPCTNEPTEGLGIAALASPLVPPAAAGGQTDSGADSHRIKDGPTQKISARRLQHGLRGIRQFAIPGSFIPATLVHFHFRVADRINALLHNLRLDCKR